MNGHPAPPAILKRATVLGLLTGVVLSNFYAGVAMPLVSIVLLSTGLPVREAFETMLGGRSIAICPGPLVLLLGILPGVILGGLSGMLNGLLLRRVGSRSSPRRGLLTGICVAAGLYLLADLALRRSLVNEAGSTALLKYLPYLFWLLGPGVVNLAGSAWLGWNLARMAQRGR